MTNHPVWTEIDVAVPAGWEELVAATLSAESASGTRVDTDEADPGVGRVRAYLSEEVDDPAVRGRIESSLAGLAESTGCAELEALSPSFRKLPPEDWATSWEKVWKPFRVGRICVVRPSTKARFRSTDLPLLLEPGGVFGSGRHATTRQCLEAIQSRVVAGTRILDAGTGTGILAVGAALLGARHVLGFDVDPNSEPAARVLAEQNSVSKICVFRTGSLDVLEATDVEFDGCLANIYSDVIQAQAHEWRKRMRDGAWFVFSGCPKDRKQQTADAIEDAGLLLEETRTRGRWVTFAGRR